LRNGFVKCTGATREAVRRIVISLSNAPNRDGMRDIAPTLAKLMEVSMPQADGKPLF
jgi:hypothetical protein